MGANFSVWGLSKASEPFGQSGTYLSILWETRLWTICPNRNSYMIVYMMFYMILLFQFLGDFWSEWVRMVRNRSGMVPEWSQTLLGHFLVKPFFSYKKRRKRQQKTLNAQTYDHHFFSWEDTKMKKTRIEIPLTMTCRTAPHLLILPLSWQKRELDIMHNHA